MTHILIKFDYEPVLSYYPDEIETEADAMRFDLQQVKDGALTICELLEGYDRQVTMEVVEE